MSWLIARLGRTLDEDYYSEDRLGGYWTWDRAMAKVFDDEAELASTVLALHDDWAPRVVEVDPSWSGVGHLAHLGRPR